MRTLSGPIYALLALLGLAAAPPAPTVREVPSPAGEGSAEPWLATSPDGRLWLSWLEPAGSSRHALRLSVWEKGAWAAPRTVVEDESLFVNWADHPSILPLADGSVAAHWLRKTGAGTYDYEVRVARSIDGGRTWSAPVVPHRDGKRGEHGFVTLLPWHDGTVAAAWVDGRKMAALSHGGHEEEGGDGEMMVRFAAIGADGSLAEEALLDARACECCPTGGALTSRGPLIAYRDRSEQEVRDIYAVRLTGGTWSDPVPVAREGWRIEGCPVNGPAVAASGDRVAVAWYSGAGDTDRVSVAFSGDAGASFTKPVRLDLGSPVGRADVALLADGAALVTWIEEQADTACVMARAVRADGKLVRAVCVAPTGRARRSGIPHVERVGEVAWFAWTDPSRPSRVRLATLPVVDLPR